MTTTDTGLKHTHSLGHINKPMPRRESNMTRLCSGSLLMYYVSTMGMCECSVCVNGHGCSVGVDASKRHKWVYFVIWNSWQKSLKHQRWVVSLSEINGTVKCILQKPLQPQRCHVNVKQLKLKDVHQMTLKVGIGQVPFNRSEIHLLTPLHMTLRANRGKQICKAATS